MEKTKLTKAVIIEHLHDKLGINRSDIHNIVDEFFEEVKAGLKEEKIIELRGFGMTMPFCDLLSINAIIGDHNGISEISDRRWACVSSVGQLEVSGVAPGACISIYDMRGTCVSKVTAVDQTVKISGISKGIYIVKVTIGKEELTEKVLVK